MFGLWFSGGSDVGTKFHCFLVTPEKELHIKAVPGLMKALRDTEYRDYYELPSPIVKVFVQWDRYQSGKPFNYSFYLMLNENEKAGNIITIRHPVLQRWSFLSTGRFLRKNETVEIIKNLDSLPFFLRQSMLPKEVLRSMITIERPELKFEGGRRLFAPKNKGGKL